MATTEHFYTGNGSTTTYPFTFPYLKNADIKVSLDDVLKTETTHYTVSSTNIVFGSAPGSNVAIRIYRDTDVDTSKATFAAGSSIRATDLNNNETQLLYGAQEQKQLIRTADIDASQITSAKIKDDTIVNADINTSAAIAGTKVTPAFGSQNLSTTGTAATGALTVTGNIAVSGTVDGRDVASDGSKLDGIAGDATGDQTASEIRILVDSATDSNVFTDADHTKLNAIEDNATADQTNAEIRAAVEAASDSNVFTDADHSKLNAIEAGATEDQTAAEIRTLVGSASDSNVYVDTHNTLVGGITASASELNKLDGVTASTTDLNQVAGLAKETTITDNDAKFPTSGAVVDYVAAQLAPVGGLEVIANDASFPNTQPAAGVVISIADAGGLVVNGSGVSTTGRTVGGSTVTINNINSQFNSSTITNGVAMMVSSTGSSQTYNYHKATLREQDITSISTDIEDFGNRYRVGSSNPTSNNDDGDLFFNTTSAKMLVWNADDGGSWDEVQSVGNFYINTISSYSGTGGNSATFNGSAYRFVLSNAPTYAQQLIVSINGVIQKPNAGTSQPSEGFVIDGSSIIFSSAPPSGADYFIVTIGSSVNIGAPSDDSVGAAAMIDGAIVNAAVNTNAAIAGSKLADDSIAEVKLDIHNAPSGTDKFLKYTSNGMEWVVPSYTTNTNTQLSNAEVRAAVEAASDSNVFTDADHTKLNGIAASANNYVHPNHSGEVTSTADGATVIADDVVDEANLKISNAGSNGQFLSKQSGNTGGLTWASVTSTPEGTAILSTGESGGAKYLREDGDGTCSWQSVPAGVGGASGVDFNDSVKARFGTDNDLRIFHDNTHGYISNLKNNLYLEAANYVVISTTDTNGSNQEISAKFLRNGNCELYHDNIKKIETTATGATVSGATQATGYESPATVAANWSIGANNNAMFPGPMTVASGVTVTVPANRTLTIV
jgi:hypothetical protein